MSNGLDPFDLLRQHAEKPVPNAEAKAKAKSQLERAIAAEQTASRRRFRHIGWRPLARAVAVVAVLVAIVPMVLSNPARAALTEVAQAAREASPTEVPEGSFIYTRSARVDLAIRPGEDFGLTEGSIAYLLPTTRQVWRSPADGFVLIHTTVETPEFFTIEAEDTYYEANIDQADQVGETIIDRFTDVTDPLIETVWPTDPVGLRTAMDSFITASGSQPVTPVAVFQLAANLLRETNPSPALRAAILEVLARLPLELGSRSETGLTVSIVDNERQLSIALSNDGELVSETITLLRGDSELGAPEGAVISRAAYEPTSVVAYLP